jgi:hypothetical protein
LANSIISHWRKILCCVDAVGFSPVPKLPQSHPQANLRIYK